VRDPVWAEPCSQHGQDCVWILFAGKVAHVSWAETDPRQIAELIQILLTRQPR
jgi:hypothetical protein